MEKQWQSFPHWDQKHTAIKQIKMIKTEKQKTQKGVSTIGNLNLKIMNIV